MGYCFRPLIIGIFCLVLNVSANSQNINEQKYTYTDNSNNKYSYTLYDFSMGYSIKVKYFASNAYNRYQNWQYGKKVLLICSGAFSNSWSSDAIPIGLTVDNGTVVNRNIDNKHHRCILDLENDSTENLSSLSSLDTQFLMNNHEDYRYPDYSTCLLCLSQHT